MVGDNKGNYFHDIHERKRTGCLNYGREKKKMRIINFHHVQPQPDLGGVRGVGEGRGAQCSLPRFVLNRNTCVQNTIIYCCLALTARTYIRNQDNADQPQI